MTFEEFKALHPTYFNGTDGKVMRVEYGQNTSHQLAKGVADEFVRSFTYPDASISATGLYHINSPQLARYQLDWAVLGMAHEVRRFSTEIEEIDQRDWSPEAHDFFELFTEPYTAFTAHNQEKISSGYSTSAYFGYATFEYLLCLVDKDHIGFIIIGDED